MDYRDKTLIPEGKLFWLDQYKELEQAAKKIAQTKQTSNGELMVIIFEYFDGKYREKGELERELLKKMLEISVPRENPGGKYKEQELF